MGLRDSTVGKALDLHAANGAQSLAMYLVPKRSLGVAPSCDFKTTIQQ